MKLHTDLKPVEFTGRRGKACRDGKEISIREVKGETFVLVFDRDYPHGGMYFIEPNHLTNIRWLTPKN